ncbi:transposase [Emticicia agri]|uniref:Transposase IS200-like domain-containing protein n=1 Tax=Emticicia agri TaxID=2492393 RepID=A0A4Q5M150_9BACT|nr:transposase [Emticicia agri]RYU95729.1 hypothetical protein EWM59_10220 [Emticicia agri]
MTELFDNKYRVPSVRLQSWNYANEGFYFVTICTKDRTCYFGDVIGSKFIPNGMGKIAFEEWHKTIELRPDMNIELAEFVVMPNHIHGILIIGRNEFNQSYNFSFKSQFKSPAKDLASIIRGYKTAVTTYARKNNIKFDWQERFYEHIIRSEEDYQKIANYIINNPAKWEEDLLYSI